MVPLLMEEPETKIHSYDTLLRLLNRLGRTCHDTRRTYVVWLGQAGVERNRQLAYMGHADDSENSLYKETENVEEDWIIPDTTKVLNWLEIAKNTPPVSLGKSVKLFKP